jgi:hypothetical protein
MVAGHHSVFDAQLFNYRENKIQQQNCQSNSQAGLCSNTGDAQDDTWPEQPEKVEYKIRHNKQQKHFHRVLTIHGNTSEL